MREYQTGDSIVYKNQRGDRAGGTVVAPLSRPEQGVYGYEVEIGEGYVATIMADQIVDWEDVSRKAGEALDRWHAEDRRKADLLSELLGRLSYYGKHNGRIVYDNEFESGYNSVCVKELVDEFLARRDAA